MSNGMTEIGVKLGLVNTLVNLTKNVCGLLKRKQRTAIEADTVKVYLERKLITFKPFHEAAKTRYLICGISLIDLPNYILRDILEKCHENEKNGNGFEFRRAQECQARFLGGKCRGVSHCF